MRKWMLFNIKNGYTFVYMHYFGKKKPFMYRQLPVGYYIQIDNPITRQRRTLLPAQLTKDPRNALIKRQCLKNVNRVLISLNPVYSFTRKHNINFEGKFECNNFKMIHNCNTFINCKKNICVVCYVIELYNSAITLFIVHCEMYGYEIYSVVREKIIEKYHYNCRYIDECMFS